MISCQGSAWEFRSVCNYYISTVSTVLYSRLFRRELKPCKGPMRLTMVSTILVCITLPGFSQVLSTWESMSRVFCSVSQEAILFNHITLSVHYCTTMQWMLHINLFDCCTVLHERKMPRKALAVENNHRSSTLLQYVTKLMHPRGSSIHFRSRLVTPSVQYWFVRMYMYVCYVCWQRSPWGSPSVFPFEQSRSVDSWWS